MHQMKMEFSARLLSNAVLALLHVRKMRRTLVYFCLRQVLCEKGCDKVTIRTVDTNMVVLDVASISKTALMSFGLHLSSVQTFCTSANSPTVCLTLPALHEFTGCDTVSSFGGR